MQHEEATQHGIFDLVDKVKINSTRKQQQENLQLEAPNVTLTASLLVYTLPPRL